MSYRDGVAYYTTGKGTVEINFPERDVCCIHCWMLYKDGVGRHMCRWLNREVYRPSAGILMDCPLEFEGEKQEEK